MGTHATVLSAPVLRSASETPPLLALPSFRVLVFPQRPTGQVGGAAGRKRHAGAGPPVPPFLPSRRRPTLRPRPEMRSEREARAGRLRPASGGLLEVAAAVRGSETGGRGPGGRRQRGIRALGREGPTGGRQGGRQRLVGAGEGGGPWFSGLRLNPGG